MTELKTKLPTTSYTILGLLSFGEEMSGYDVRQWAQSMKFFYWSPAQSQVYSELRRLAEHDLVTMREVRQSGKPDKRLYQITDAGVTEFQRWWASDELDTTTVLKHSVVLKIFFGHMGTPEKLIELLEKFSAEQREHLSQLGVVQEYMENDEAMSYPALAAEWSYHYCKAELEMAQKLVTRLKQKL